MIIYMKFILFKEIGITKFKEILKIILFYFKSNIKINYLRILDIILKFMNISLVMNNRSYVEKVSYNINMISLTEKQRIEEFKIKITKTIINLIKNYN